MKSNGGFIIYPTIIKRDKIIGKIIFKAKVFVIDFLLKLKNIFFKLKNINTMDIKNSVYDFMRYEEKDQVSKIYEENKLFFDKAISLLRLCYELINLNIKEPKYNIDPLIVNGILLFFIQSIRLYRSIIILFKSGLDNESLILLRSLLECISYLVYITEDNYKERFNDYQHSRALSYYVAVKEFSELSEYYTLDHQTIKNRKIAYEEAIEYFKTKYGKRFKDKHKRDITEKDIKQKYTLRADLAAQKVKNENFKKHYKITHRFISPIAHGENIYAYLKSTSLPETFVLKIDPTSDNVSFYITEVMTLILHGCKAFNEFLKIGKDEVVNKMFHDINNLIPNIKI